MALLRNPTDVVVVREAVLGSRNVETPLVNASIIRGLRASRPANVSYQKWVSDHMFEL